MQSRVSGSVPLPSGDTHIYMHAMRTGHDRMLVLSLVLSRMLHREARLQADMHTWKGA
jgi:hypothetical protein